MSNGGQPPFSSRATIQSKIFHDTYYDLGNKLSNTGLWVRKRSLYPPHKHVDISTTCMWEAKQSAPGSSFVRSTYDETQDPKRILQMVRNRIPRCPGPGESFGLEETCRF